MYSQSFKKNLYVGTFGYKLPKCLNNSKTLAVPIFIIKKLITIKMQPFVKFRKFLKNGSEPA